MTKEELVLAVAQRRTSELEELKIKAIGRIQSKIDDVIARRDGASQYADRLAGVIDKVAEAKTEKEVKYVVERYASTSIFIFETLK